MENNQKIKYFLYARKSSESEDKQVASIDSQIEELKKIAQKEKLEIIAILQESQSAKAPGRPIFNQLIQRISHGEAQGILCWKLDRLARNFIDSGSIIDSLQKGIIQKIRTYDRVCLPSDNVLMMAIEFGVANQFIRDLSENTKRGLRNKVSQGWLPGRPPIGYLNNKFKEKGKKDIIRDPKRFHLIKQLWDKLLIGGLSIKRLYEIANDDLGLTIKGKNGEKRISLSKFYQIFTNPFYCGHFNYGGAIYKGNHEPMITEEQFALVQKILKTRSKAPLRFHTFAFTGLIKCGECGASITAEDKIKIQKNGNRHRYIYYRCTKRINPRCAQKPIRLEGIEAQISETLKDIQIPEEFYNWAMNKLKRELGQELESRTYILKNQQKEYNECLREIDGLISMRAKNEIDEENFKRKMDSLIERKNHFKELLDDTDDRVNKQIIKADTSLNFAQNAKQRFETGNLDVKREVLVGLGYNLFLKDGKLLFSIKKPLECVKQAVPIAWRIKRRLEPVKTDGNEAKLEELYSKNAFLGG